MIMRSTLYNVMDKKSTEFIVVTGLFTFQSHASATTKYQAAESSVVTVLSLSGES